MDFVFLGQLTAELRSFRLAFHLSEPAEVEFRVRGNASTPIIVADDAVAVHAADAPAPLPSQAPDCALVSRTPHEIVKLFVAGRMPAKVPGGFNFVADGILVHAEEYDDVNFIHEIFNQKAYNLNVEQDQCVIDVGMNVGLSSLVFAARDRVKEVHAFEPFESTYAKALANLSLNPSISHKISHHNAGLSDRDELATIYVPETSDSGSRSTFDKAGGIPVTLSLRNAADTLRPIITAARSKGLFVLAKIDCEGSEFAIFESLETAGLLPMVDAFMVEWHRFFPDKNAETLTGPLLKAGFAVIDLSPPDGNGFFYAIKHPSQRA